MVEHTGLVEMTAGHAVFGVALGATYAALSARVGGLGAGE
jgi:hypothetical protein